MKKPTFYTEIAYLLGLLLLAMGTAMMAAMELGISMVVAPAYILHLNLSQHLPFFSFGVAEYVLQALVLLLMMLVLRRVRLRYFLSLGTAVVYGFLLDAAMQLAIFLPGDTWLARMGVYSLGVLLCTAGIALLFRSYLPPAAYELFVKEISAKFGWQVSRVKLCYDCASCAIAAALSLILLGRLEAVGIGTVVCAVLYGPLIGLFDRLLGKTFDFTDKFTLKEETI